MSARRGERVRVAAVEDDARYRTSLEVLFRHSPEFVLVETMATPDELLENLASGGPEGGTARWDLVLMDLGLPGMSGIECTRRVKAVSPNTTVVALTVFEDRSSILGAICAGADGYLLKRTPADELLAQLRSVLGGGSPLSVGVAKTVLEAVRRLDESSSRSKKTSPVQVGLTPREHQVLACLVEGKSYKATASNCTDFPIPGPVDVLEGEAVATAANGDVLRTTYSGVQDEVDMETMTAPFALTVTVVGGSGRFEGASGTVELTGIVDFNPDGISTGVWDGWIVYDASNRRR